MERIIHERFELKIKEAFNYPAPLMIGIIYDIIEGKSLAQVEKTFKNYQGRDKVQQG